MTTNIKKTQEALRMADNALDRMAENARELGLDYEPPCKTGSQCTSKCQQCEQPAQPSKPWVGLTDEEVEDLYFDGFSMSELKQFARAIEAKLREKNA